MADMAAGVVLGFPLGGLVALYFVHRQSRIARRRLQRIFDPTRGYLDEK